MDTPGISPTKMVYVDDPTELFRCNDCKCGVRSIGQFQGMIVHTMCEKCKTNRVLSPRFMKRFMAGEVKYEVDKNVLLNSLNVDSEVVAQAGDDGDLISDIIQNHAGDISKEGAMANARREETYVQSTSD